MRIKYDASAPSVDVLTPHVCLYPSLEPHWAFHWHAGDERLSSAPIATVALTLQSRDEEVHQTGRRVIDQPPRRKSSGRSDARHSTAQVTKAEELGLFPGAVPTRTWKPGKVWIARDGIFPKSPKCLNAYAPFESTLEALAHLHLSVDVRIRHYVCQPAPLHFWMPGADGGQDKREYTPDFVALTRDERLLVIDAKATRFAAGEKWTSREPYIRAAYRSDHNAELIVWTEQELEAEPRLSNARTMYRHRHAPADGSCEFAIYRELEERECGTSSIGRLCDTVSSRLRCDGSDVFGAIMRFALEGLVTLASDTRYNRETQVRLRELAE